MTYDHVAAHGRGAGLPGLTACNRAVVGVAVLLCLLEAHPVHAQEYHTYSQIEAALQDAETDYPDICRRVYLGDTVQRRAMWALGISDNIGVQEDEPEFRYISTMHGDEVMGVEMCLNLIDHLTTNYGTDPRVSSIVNSVELWIQPCMNPDGFVAGTRGNAGGYDLNRNFPDPFTSPNNTTSGRQAETINIMEWSFAHSFTLAANFHGGALVVNYPFDTNPSGSSVYTPTPDDDLFIWISEEYSQHNTPMWNSPTFFHGITNGADWYAINGGMQDWSYRYMGSNEVTIEVSNIKTPPPSQIPTFWSQNRESMLAYIETCLIGVRGVVTDAVTGLPLAATVAVTGRDHQVYTDPDVGDYHRMLLPGVYSLTIDGDGHDPVVVADVMVSSGEATRIDAELWRTAVIHPNGGESLDAGVPTTVTWTGNPSVGFGVQYTANAGDTAQVADDFESGALGPDYTTSGDATWEVVSGVAHSGSYAARSGTITHDQVTWLTRTADSGPVSFWYRVSSEANWDWFNFYIDGVQQIHRSGTVEWTNYSTTLTEGPHELKWEYVKDGSVSSGSDAAWIDDLVVTTDATVWTDIVTLTDPGVTSVEWTPSSLSDECKVRVRADYGGGSYGAWDESDDTFRVKAPSTATGDSDGDGDVDLLDVADFVLCFGASPSAQCREVFDFDGDGDIDLTDYVEFLPRIVGPGEDGMSATTRGKGSL